MKKLTLRLMGPEEAAPVSEMIRRVLLEVNARDYPPDFIADYARSYGPERVNENLEAGGHVYVALDGAELVGCGAVVPSPGQPGECLIQTVYVRPDREKAGIGRELMAALERDEIFLAASRALVSASITAHEFYHKLGYRYAGGVKTLEENDHYWMEKEKRR